MGITVMCQSCGSRRTVPAHLYEDKIKGRVVKIACRACGALIAVDGTVPPPGAADTTSTPTTDDPLKLVTVEPPKPPEERAAPTSSPISEQGPTHTVGRYALFEQFAAGGMATVHFGRLDGAGGFARVVAIKRLLPHLVENREFTQMLLTEARVAARVRHPNVVATLDVVATQGDVLLVLDYVHGEALSTLCRTQAKQKQEHVPLPIVVGIALDMLQGLVAVHEATDEKGKALSLVHRDVSPPNVLVGVDGVARVLDFGIATALDHIEESAPERRKGKRGYMSPEQVRGERLTQRSDIFSAGVVIWELLALRRLFPAEQENEPGEAVLRGGYPRASQYRPELPEALDEIVMKALALDPGERFASMHELLDAFETHAPARANARRVGEWVLELAKDALSERSRKLLRVENWQAEELPLKSTPFAAELPLRPASTSTRPPEVFQASIPVDIPPPPPLPRLPLEAASERSSRPPSPSSAPLLAAREPSPKTQASSRWWLWALLLVAVAAYFAFRAI